MNNLETYGPMILMDKNATPEGKESDAETTRKHEMANQLFYLWMFISNQGLIEEARDFLEEFSEYPAPIMFS